MCCGGQCNALYVQARLRVGARLQHLQAERGKLVAKLQALADPQDVEMYEQVRAQDFAQHTCSLTACGV